jgi:hypothetical protein
MKRRDFIAAASGALGLSLLAKFNFNNYKIGQKVTVIIRNLDQPFYENGEIVEIKSDGTYVIKGKMLMSGIPAGDLIAI